MSLIFLFLFIVSVFSLSQRNVASCGSSCKDDSDCLSNQYNYCTFCNGSGTCSPMCGVGCRRDSDCDTGGPQPCTKCVNTQCVNPVPHCGEFCGYGVDAACRYVLSLLYFFLYICPYPKSQINRYDGDGPCAGVNNQCCQCHPTDLEKVFNFYKVD
jgi:hypothetical protein